MITIKLKQIGYALGIGAFVLSIAASLVINNSLPLLVVAFPLILFNRAYVLPLLLIIPAIEGALTVGDTPPITESLAIAGLIPLFAYDILRTKKVVIPAKVATLYFIFFIFIVMGFFVYSQHPEILANSTRKGIDDVYKKMFMKAVKILFFFIYLKFLVNKEADFLKKALHLFKNIIPYLILIIAAYLVVRGHAGNKFGSLHFGDAHHGDFTANISAMGVYLYIALFEKNKNLIYKSVMVVALAAMAYIIFQMASRNGLLSFAFISIISAYLVLKNRSTGLKVLVVLFGISAVIAVIVLFQDSPTIQRSIYQTEVESGGDRIFYWASGIQAIGQEPFVGFGGDETSSLYAVSKYAPEVEDHVMHNTFLEFAVEYGLLGLAFFLVFVSTIIRWGYRNFKYALKSNDLILAAPGVSYLISIFAGLFISRVWESTLWYNMSLVFAIGILWVYSPGRSGAFKNYVRGLPIIQTKFDKQALT